MDALHAAYCPTELIITSDLTEWRARPLHRATIGNYNLDAGGFCCYRIS